MNQMGGARTSGWRCRLNEPLPLIGRRIATVKRRIGIAVAIVVGRDGNDGKGQCGAGRRGVAGEVDNFDIERDLAIGQRERQLD